MKWLIHNRKFEIELPEYTKISNLYNIYVDDPSKIF